MAESVLIQATSSHSVSNAIVAVRSEESEVRLRSRVCVGCGVCFTYRVARGSDRRYCTDECAKEHRSPPTLSAKTCSASGCVKPTRSPTADLCECHYGRRRRNGHLEGPKEPKSPGFCDQCGVAVSNGRMYCSIRCSTRSSRQIDDRKSLRSCAICGKDIQRSRRADSLYCSERCNQQASYRQRRAKLTVGVCL